MRRLMCRYPRHVCYTSEGMPCHGVTVAVQYLPVRWVASDARESSDEDDTVLDSCSWGVYVVLVERHLVNKKERRTGCITIIRKSRHVRERTSTTLRLQTVVVRRSRRVSCFRSSYAIVKQKPILALHLPASKVVQQAGTTER
jgi:hypothetical protein